MFDDIGKERLHEINSKGYKTLLNTIIRYLKI